MMTDRNLHDRFFTTSDLEVFKRQYFVESEGEFTLVKNGATKDDLVKYVKENFDIVFEENSPHSDSAYFFTSTRMYRVANHWGEFAGVDWRLTGIVEKTFQLAYIRFEDMKLMHVDCVSPVSYIRLRKTKATPRFLEALKEDAPLMFEDGEKEPKWERVYTMTLSSAPKAKAAVDADAIEFGGVLGDFE